jgi:transcriptional regulator with XRE-family HTH domain
MNQEKEIGLRQAVGKALKILRTARGIKQSDLANRIAVQKNYISMIENGRREPSLSFLQAAARALDVPIEMFFVFARDSTELPPQSAISFARLQQILLQLAHSEPEEKPQ